MAITAGRDRILLATLLLHAGRVVDHATLAEALWGIGPPHTARSQVQTCVSRLRRRLPPGAIVSDPAGYRWTGDPDDVDAAIFARLVARARAGSDAALYREALDLWRGEALVGIDSQPVRAGAAALDEQYVAAVEEWAELELAAGRDRELIGPLTAAIDRFPLRERLRGRLIRALVGAGRVADALAEFRRTRRLLVEELGIEPGAELQELHRRVLSADEAAPVRSLPRTVGDFTGRDEVVARLLAELDRPGPAIAAIDGMPGSGKTTLALHVASLAGERFPDAHLFVDLHGHSAEQPLEPGAALLILLRQLGIPAAAIPAELGDRITRWRSELASRRALVIFDNAYSSAQLADLLPTAPGSAALVTSRRRLLGLDGVHPVQLAVLSPGDALALLARIAGGRIAAESAAAAEVVRRCGGLPLALRLAGARLAHRPRWQVADLVRRLGESALPDLAAEDRSVAAAFALSYGQLGEPARRLFRLLGVYPAPLFDAVAAAALAGLPLNEAHDLLDELIDGHLLDEPEPGIFRLHDLLREYAAALAGELPPDAAEAVLDLQVHAFAAALPPVHQRLLRRDIGAHEPLRPDLLAELADPTARFEWERPQLGAYVQAAGDTRYAWWIPRAAWWHLFNRGYNDDLRVVFEQSMRSVEKSGDRQGIAIVANYLASAYVRLSDYPRALEMVDRAIRLHAELGNWRAVATTLGNRAGVYDAAGRFADCVTSAQESLRLRALHGAVNYSPTALTHLAGGYARLGRYAEALRYGRRALFLAVETGDAGATAMTLINIQKCKREAGLGSPMATDRYLAVALRLTRLRGNRPTEAEVLNEKAIVLRHRGRHDEAVALHEAAITIVRGTSDRLYEVTFIHDLAITRGSAGDRVCALELHRRALRLAQAHGMAYLAACAEAGIADCLAQTDPEQARRLWLVALAAFRQMGVPEQYEVERRLAAAS
ncbi:tetratricopeptide repeat protein [Actinoplanes sp. KI2]|uniref:AfsR/SARP family transcriptional regulator n=1 Tax=Actinoplanes sp. KI2 TaxID=2983315 RepID=UPI0021D569FE|nr:AfsR/SARP family transcriptional regulator [Actinoplanes sp. KI2]MCU7727227.1 tetratricopeptide repeat protein [Actinoplanes sp. KI2]